MDVIFKFIYSLSESVYNLMFDLLTATDPIFTALFFLVVLGLIIAGIFSKFVHFVVSIVITAISSACVFYITEFNYERLLSSFIPSSIFTVYGIAFFAMTLIFYYPTLTAKMKSTLGPIGGALVCIFAVTGISIGVVFLIQMLLSSFSLLIAPYIMLVVYWLMLFTVPSLRKDK